MKFVLVYCPRHTPDITRDLKMMASKIGESFLLGNLNAHHISWNCDKTDTDGKLLFNHQTYNYYVSYLLDFLKTSPTDSRR